jgi:aryl-alcohol dehydrogenase-like predicted oxidoreductase
MNTVPVGTSGLRVSMVGMGCWSIGGPFWDRAGWMGYGDVEDDESVRAIHRGLDLGVTFFDTADVYGCGHSERVLGRALVRRKDVFVSDKFGFVFDEAERKVLGQDASPAGIRSACEGALSRLGRDTLEMFTFQLWDHPLAQMDEVIATLDDLVDEGKVRTYGWLTDDVERVRYMAGTRHCHAAPQVLNVLEHNPALIALCEEKNLAILVRRPLGMGLLTGKFTAESQFPENDMRRRFGWDFKSGKQARLNAKLAAIREVLTRDGRTLAQGALGWIWGRTRLAAPCPGFKNVRQAEENIGAAAFGPISPEQMQEVEAILASMK